MLTSYYNKILGVLRGEIPFYSTITYQQEKSKISLLYLAFINILW